MRVEFYGKEGTLKEMVVKYAKSYLIKTEIFKLKPDMSFKDFIRTHINMNITELDFMRIDCDKYNKYIIDSTKENIVVDGQDLIKETVIYGEYFKEHEIDNFIIEQNIFDKETLERVLNDTVTDEELKFYNRDMWRV